MTQRTGSTAAEFNEILRFGPFRLDPAARELRRGDEEIAVPPKSMACLMYLIARRDRAVDRDELIEAIWGHSHLTDGALAQTILQLRKALGDGDGTHFVKSVRGYGYRWAAEALVEPATDGNPIAADPILATPEATPHSPAPAPAPALVRKGYSNWLLAASLLAVALGVGGGIVWHFVGARGDGRALNPATVSNGLVLVLPVEVFDTGESDWVRLGVMDMISTRLRRSGLAVVPVETVLQLLRGHDDESPAQRATRLVEATGSKWILSVSARSVEHRWSVSIRGLTEHGPINALRGDASEVLDATHQAMDVLALTLGIPSGSALSGDPKSQLLMHRTQAAVLERRFDEALGLIGEAPAELRVLPEIRLLTARIRFEQRSYPLARDLFERLLEDPAAKQYPELMLRARVNLAATLAALGEVDAAQSMMLDIVNRTDANLDARVMANVNGNLGVTAVGKGDRVAAKRYFMQAQRFLTGGGDIHALAKLDFLIGVLEDQEDRPIESLRHLERARAGFDAVGDARGSIRVRAAMIAAQLQLLDVPAAAAIEPMFLSNSASSPVGEDPSEAQVVLASLWRAQGRNTQAWASVHALIAGPADDFVSAKYLLAANSLRARWLIEDGGPADQAIAVARTVTGSEEALKDGQQRAVVADAWLAQIRAEIRLHRLDEAQRALGQFSAWPGHGETPTTKVFLSLARAEIADALGRFDEARTHYDDAVRISDSSGTPRLTLDVARSFVPWLLRQKSGAVEAMWVSDRLNVHHDRHFDAALIRLRVLQRNGPVASWRAALRVAEALAGERTIPNELLSVPTTAIE
jgi:DNA-binding winged helix-turn-helix (wHTH) protein/tetratricopeptide (TPR) repeat protein